MLNALINEGGYLCSEKEKLMLEKAMWDENGNRTFPTIACPPQQLADSAGFSVPDNCKFLMVENVEKLETEGGYAKESSEDFKKKTRESFK